MTKIKKYVDAIDDELCSAKEYAEKYVEYKAKADNTWMARYKQMATDELNHANWLHEKAMQEIEEINKVFQPTQKMLDKWEKSHAEYVEKSAWIKQMLAM